jgi:hypothetical protein
VLRKVVAQTTKKNMQYVPEFDSMLGRIAKVNKKSYEIESYGKVVYRE